MANLVPLFNLGVAIAAEHSCIVRALSFHVGTLDGGRVVHLRKIAVECHLYWRSLPSGSASEARPGPSFAPQADLSIRPSQVRTIAELVLAQTAARLGEHDVGLQVSAAAMAHLCDAGYDEVQCHWHATHTGTCTAHVVTPGLVKDFGGTQSG